MIANQIAGLLTGGVVAPLTDYESIQTTTVGAGGTSTITFSSIPSTYSHLQIRMLSNDGSGNNNNFMRFNSDTASNYSWHYMQGNGTSATSGGSASQTSMICGKTGITATGNGVAVIDILDYTDANKYKTIRSLSGTDYNNSNGILFYSSGNWRSTSAVTTVTLTNDSGTNFTQYSSFALYGIK
jgi:hypothetical protein